MARKAAFVFLWAAGLLPAQVQPGTRAGRSGAGAGNVYTIYDSETIQRGKALFTAHCGFCHGANARGGESGPDLLRAVPVLDDEDGNLVGPIVLNGRADRGMPKFNLTKQQISDVAAFLHEGVRAAAQRLTYQVQNIVTGDAAAGKAYFNGAGKCGACHSPTGDLSHVGSRYDPVALQTRFLMPRAGRGGAQSRTALPAVTVTIPGGKTFGGKLEQIDDFVVALTDANGDYHSFARKGDVPKVAVTDPLQAHLDLLPKYTDADIHNLTAYLVTLK